MKKVSFILAAILDFRITMKCFVRLFPVLSSGETDIMMPVETLRQHPKLISALSAKSLYLTYICQPPAAESPLDGDPSSRVAIKCT